MKLTYVYHSGFVLQGEKGTLIIDYYKDSKGKKEGIVHDLLASLSGKCYVLVSHSHPDHYNPDIWKWSQERPELRYLLSDEIQLPEWVQREQVVFLKKGDTWKDEWLEVKAYGSTDTGISFFLKAEGKRIFHAGDLNNWHWEEESTPEEVRKAESDYKNELEVLAKDLDYLDIVMFPVDPRLGENYMRGACQFVEKIRTGWFVPMHFWEKYEKANAFRLCAERNGSQFVAWSHPGESIDF